LQKRTKIFLHNSSDSIVGWTDKVEDYGGLNLFTQYLTEHYGKEILIDSLQSGASGIASINQALIKNGFKEDFAQIFTDWGIPIINSKKYAVGRVIIKHESDDTAATTSEPAINSSAVNTFPTALIGSVFASSFGFTASCGLDISSTILFAS